MSLKAKLTGTVCAFFLVLGLVIMGVFAAPQASVNLGGTISFTATDVYAKVSGTIDGTAAETQPTLDTLTFDSENEPTGWSSLPLSFKEDGSQITITITIENLATDRPLYATVTDTVGEVDNLTKTMTVDSGELITLNPSTGEGTSKTTVTITMEVTDKDLHLLQMLLMGMK